MSGLLIIGIIATFLIVIENIPHALHRFITLFSSPTPYDNFIVVVFIFAPLVLVWAGYCYFKKKNFRYREGTFLALVMVIFLVMAFFLPSDGYLRKSLFMCMEWRNISTAIIDNITDQPLLSANGNPIGIRLTYSVKFSGKDSFIEQTHFYPVSRLPTPDSVDYDTSGVAMQTFVPPNQWNGPIYPKDHMEKVIVQAVPFFMGVDFATSQFCLSPLASKIISQSTLPGRTKYKIIIPIVGKHTLLNQASLRTFETQQSYDVREFYQNALNEKIPICKP